MQQSDRSGVGTEVGRHNTPCRCLRVRATTPLHSSDSRRMRYRLLCGWLDRGNPTPSGVPADPLVHDSRVRCQTG